jgi:molybdopterin-containing oxidoreductase family iron-sulfur binding subunit
VRHDSSYFDPESKREWETISGMDAISRRRFLSLLSASAALAAGVSCSTIDRGSIVPYTRRPGEILPGVAAYYASCFQEGLSVHPVLVKTREGRPIHIEGFASLRAMGDLLSLYDPDRLHGPLHGDKPTDWAAAENSLVQALTKARGGNKAVLFVTGAVVSPTQMALINELKSAWPNLHHVAWEAVAPLPGVRVSNTRYGNYVMPNFRFNRADVILSLQSDFLNSGESPPKWIRDFASRRAISNPSEAISRLWVLEGPMTLTGSNADRRLQVRPSGIAAAGFAVALELARSHSFALPQGLNPDDFKKYDIAAISRNLHLDPSTLKFLAADLARAGKSALVVAGPALPVEAHLAAHMLNSMLEAEGNTIEWVEVPAHTETLAFAELGEILKEAARGKYAVGIFWNANPAYAFPDAALWKSAIEHIPETYRISLYQDETAQGCSWKLPEHHWLESWGDFHSASGFLSLRQPTIGCIHNTKQAEEFLLGCLRKVKSDAPAGYLEFMKRRWQSDVYPQETPVPFERYWNSALHDGGLERGDAKRLLAAVDANAVAGAVAEAARQSGGGKEKEFELVLAPSTGVYDGRYANNGWLNELPDPVTKATWSNPLHMSIADAGQLQLDDGDVVRITSGSVTADVPVIVQPGQCPGVVSLALGYGRKTGSVAAGIGINAYPLADVSSNSPYLVRKVRIQRPERRAKLSIPRSRNYNRMEGRDLARSWTLAAYSEKIKQKKEQLGSHHSASLIPPQRFPEAKWGMVVDLSACVGCSACVIACQSENNVPVVGPEQVLKGREMHWIRIDRYYEGDLGDPSARHQPVLCQQCDNAPCEIVCPVNATTHSPDGLNQMAYNRCVGTRYCSNNCPFKVRRFNFFDYKSMKKEPEILVHNPEVTVRPRGVMEKCTFCIQRIQNARQQAKIEGRKIIDGEIKPACVDACPAGAMVFGDLNDPASRVSRLSESNRGYRMLEELGIKPSVTYLADIANTGTEKGKA